MKSTTSITVLAGLYSQVATLVVAGPVFNSQPSSSLDRRSAALSESGGVEGIPGVLTTIPQPHDQIRLYHKHPTTSPGIINSGKRAVAAAGSTTTTTATIPSVQGGAVLQISESKKKDKQKKIQSVSATFRVPLAKMPTRGPTGNNPVGVYAASFWVGIDGVVIPSSSSSSSSSSTPGVDGGGLSGEGEGGCNPSAASLRLGIDISYDGTLGGELTPYAWYQWLPNSAVGFANFTVSSGDLVRLTASSSSSSNSSGGGTVTIENFGNPDINTHSRKKKKNNNNKKTAAAAALQTATHTFPISDIPLCQTQASIIIEDFPLSGLPDFPIALTNFTEIKFDEIKIKNNQGESIPLDSKIKGHATVLDIYQEPQGGRLTDCEIQGRNKVVCERVVGGV